MPRLTSFSGQALSGKVVVRVYNLTTGTVVITGTVNKGDVLTASSTLSDDDGISIISYQWNRNGISIAGATTATYTLVSADAGTIITVTANYTEGSGESGSVTSEGTDPITDITYNYIHPTYGTLVATFTSDWQPTTGISATEGTPQPSDSTNVILSNSAFQSVRAATTSNLVYYVWGSSLQYYVSFYRSQIEAADDRPAPTTTINPNNFGLSSNSTYRVHFWNETAGFSGSGSDYSFVSYRDTNLVSLYKMGTVKPVSTNITFIAPGYYNDTSPKFQIFYK
jgi:hypothetical protein